MPAYVPTPRHVARLTGLLGLAVVWLAMAPAHAASQGGLGAVSSGTLNIQVHKAPRIAVAGARDVVFTDAGAGTGAVWSDVQAVCVHGRGIAGFRLTTLDSAPRVEVNGRPADGAALLPAAGERGCAAGEEALVRLGGSGGADSSVVTLMLIPE